MAERIMECVTTEEIFELLIKWDLKDAVIKSVCRKIEEHVIKRTGNKLETGIMLFSEHHGFLGQTERTGEILAFYNKKEVLL